MNSSLYTGVLGLKNHQTRMDVIGNNIANVNTYGFKKGRATFADLLSRTYYAAAAPRNGRGGINPLQVGMGMTTAAVTNIMNQGQLETTGRLTDMAVDGNGWFVLEDGSGDTVYTRDGAFGLDKEGSLVSANGWYTQGWTTVKVDDDHNFTVDTQRPVTDINFELGEKMEAAATNKVGLKCNLNEHSRSIIADGIDPKEGYATTNDLLVDLYDNDSTNPTHLGLREGDWVEIKADTSYVDQNSSGQTASVSSTGATALDYVARLDGSTQTIYTYTGFVDSDKLPMLDDGTIGITDADGEFAIGGRTYVSPQELAELKAGGTTFAWTLDPDTGVVYSTDPMDSGGAGRTSNVQFTFTNQKSSENTMPRNTEIYSYFQVSNDTTIGDLENAIQNALKNLDVKGTLATDVVYDQDEAKFVIYNKNKPGMHDYNDLHVEINAVSGSGIRRGYLLRESTDPSVSGAQLGITNGALGGLMGREYISTVDYQTGQVNLDYGEINGSAQIYGQVVNARLSATYSTGMTTLDVSNNDWTGYTNSGQLEAVEDTTVLTVDGTVWTQVDVFTGASNEYRVSTAAGNAPAIMFNTDDPSAAPTNGASMVLNYETTGSPNNLLVEGTDYSIDSETGQISLKWSGSTGTALLGASTGDGGNAGFTGTVRLTADYTTEQRSLTPPNLDEPMKSRWADFAYELASTNQGGAGHGRTEFNNMFNNLNASRSDSTPGIIGDEATSTEPTEIETARFQAGEVYRTSIDVYDSLGDMHTLQFIFTHVGSNYDLTEQERNENRWYWRAELPYEDVFSFDSLEFLNGNSSTARLDGEIRFDEDGLIIQDSLGTNTGPIMFDPSPIGLNGVSTGAVDTVSIDLDMDGHGELIDGVTQFASDFTTRAYEQNGWAMGVLETFAVDQSGIIEGRYSNNVVKPIAQVALAMFPNEEGLHKEGNNVFSLSANTGLPNVVPAYTGGAGAIIGGSLEQSNVDIVEEFTAMITTERGFQANSRTITTSDEMLMEVINLKR